MPLSSYNLCAQFQRWSCGHWSGISQAGQLDREFRDVVTRQVCKKCAGKAETIRLLIPSSFCLPPVGYCFGTESSHVPKFRALLTSAPLSARQI